MANDIEAVCKLLDHENAEVQCAAAIVLGELKPKERSVRKALCGALKGGSDSLKMYALSALAKIGNVESVTAMLPLLAESSQVKNKTVEVIQSFGATVIPILESALSSSEGAARKGLLEMMGKIRGSGSISSLLKCLFDKDFEVVKQATIAVKEKIAEMGDQERKKFRGTLGDFMKSAQVKKNSTVTVSCLKILGALRDPETIADILQYTAKSHPPAVRTNGLLALANMDYSGAKTGAVALKIFPLLNEEDFANIVSLALDLLWKLNVGKESAGRIFPLLKSPHIAVRLFALRSLGNVATKESAGKLVDALAAGDPKQAEMAESSLRRNEGFSQFLVKNLKSVKDLPLAWKLANVLKSYRKPLDKATAKYFLSRCVALLEKNEGGAHVYYEMLRGSATAALRETFLRKGRDLLKKKQFEIARRFLSMLEREELSTEETEFALAVAEIKLAPKDLTTAGRDKGHALQIMTRLIKREGFNLVKALKAEAKLLKPEDYLYIGFHFVESTGPDREFGAEILRFTAARFGRTDEGKTAKRKLHSEGL